MTVAWPEAQLSEIARPVVRPIAVLPGTQFRTIGVKWWGEGAYERQTIDGSQTAAKILSVVRAGDLIINKIWVRHGSTAIASQSVDGCAASGEFPTFELDPKLVLPQWLHWHTKTRGFWAECDALSRGSSGKNRIKPDLFLTIRVPLPSIDEQRRIVARIEAIAEKVEEARRLADGVDRELSQLLATVRTGLSERAPRCRLGDVAPLLRRPVAVDVAETYQQVAVRSFGRGSFHKEPLVGADVTWEKPFRVAKDDILISNIKAWEGAIAVATPDDDGRVASHRYLTLVPNANVATAKFLVAYLLSPDGLFQIGAASPGSADRNRTLSAKKLMEIEVPVPTHGEQMKFDSVVDHVARVRSERNAAIALNAGLMPTVLDKAFRGEM